MKRYSQQKVPLNLDRDIAPSYLRTLRVAVLISRVVRLHKEDASDLRGTKIAVTEERGSPTTTNRLKRPDFRRPALASHWLVAGFSINSCFTWTNSPRNFALGDDKALAKESTDDIENEASINRRFHNTLFRRFSLLRRYGHRSASTNLYHASEL